MSRARGVNPLTKRPEEAWRIIRGDLVVRPRKVVRVEYEDWRRAFDEAYQGVFAAPHREEP